MHIGRYYVFLLFIFVQLIQSPLTFYFVTAPATDPSHMDVSSLLESIQNFEENNLPSGDAETAAAALPHTMRHQYLIDEVTQSFITTLHNVKNGKWKAAILPVTHRLHGKSKSAPKILVDLGGKKTPAKVQLANKALIDWMAVMKKKSNKPSEVKWYQPSTQNQRLRTLLGSLSKQYDWRFDINDFSFKGGLKAFLNNLYQKRFKEYGKV